MGKTTLYIVRHCEAESNMGRAFNGHFDADITENGLRQLRALEERFARVPLDAVYSSDLQRAFKTARAIRGERGMYIHATPRLREIHGGDWEGVGWEELPLRWPDIYETWDKDMGNVCLPGGESMQQVLDRAMDVVGEIVTRHRGGHVAAATHGALIKALCCHLSGWELDHIGEIPWCDNTAVTTVEFDDAGRPAITALGDRSHLSDEISTLAKQSWWLKQQL